MESISSTDAMPLKGSPRLTTAYVSRVCLLIWEETLAYFGEHYVGIREIATCCNTMLRRTRVDMIGADDSECSLHTLNFEP